MTDDISFDVNQRRSDYIPFATRGSGTAYSVHAAIHRADAIGSLIKQALAVEEYRVKHGEYPQTLEQTVPQILPALPVDWSRIGKKMPCGYRLRAPHDCQVYICGDGQDNHGFQSSFAVQRGTDIVLRLSRP